MISIRPSTPEDGDRVVQIWRDAVDATHGFLSPEDRVALDELICGFLPQAPLSLAVDDMDYPLAFMLIDDDHMEALSADPPRISPRLNPCRIASANAAKPCSR